MFHYRKNTCSRASKLCRASSHGKDFFAVQQTNNARQQQTHGKGGHKHTAKKVCTAKAEMSARQRSKARQRPRERTAKKTRTAKAHTSAVLGSYAVCHAFPHGKGAFAVRHPFAVRISPFQKKNIFCFILFTTYVYFSISFIFC
jgi:hypothetical protein